MWLWTFPKFPQCTLRVRYGVTRSLLHRGRRLMKHLYTCLAALLLLLSIATTAAAQAYTVRNYDVEIYLDKTGYFDVVEKYDVDFDVDRHGIIREIITKYKFENSEGEVVDRTIGISNIEVPGHKVKQNSSLSRRKNGALMLRIGHPKKWVRGMQHYEIRYRVKNAFIFEDDHVLFYWNVKPSGWDAPFEHIRFTVHAPEGVPIPKEQTFVYAGISDDEPSDAFDYAWDGNTFRATSHPDFSSGQGHSVTALIRLPEGTIKDETSKAPAWFQYLGFILAPFLLIGYFFTWIKHGKDDRPVQVTTYYPPDGIDPPLAGFLVNDKANPTDLLSLIPKWGAEGKVRLEETEKHGLILKRRDLILHKLDDLPVYAADYEQTIFNGLFPDGTTSVAISDLRNVFHVHMTMAQKELQDASRAFYDKKSDNIRSAFTLLSVIGGAGLGFVFLNFFSLLQGLTIAGTFGVILILSRFLERKNALGTKTYGEVLGFREFVKIADADRIAMLIKDDPDYFEKTMSYAMAFGLLKEWAAKFEALNIPPPNWYAAAGAGVGMNSFARSFDSNMSAARSAMVSSPPSSSSSGSGGGSSGGGFGGGGGSSW